MFRLRALLPCALLLWSTLAAAESPASPTCEEQVSAQVRQLAQDQILAASEGPWLHHLALLTTQIRTQRTEYDIKAQQAKLAEQNVAQLLEQLRQVRAQQQATQAELDRLKGSPPPQN